jgi:hypothetical protein
MESTVLQGRKEGRCIGHYWLAPTIASNIGHCLGVSEAMYDVRYEQIQYVQIQYEML